VDENGMSQDSQASKSPTLISVVVPVYNEAEVVREFYRRLSLVRMQLSIQTEVIFVNDGSKDDTLEILRSLKSADPTIGIVDLSRNFGKEIALSAGIDRSRGDAVIIIDADLQDPPELIPKLIERWCTEDVDVIYAQRASRTGESHFKKVTAYVFYRVINAFGGQFIPVDTGDFRILSRRVVEALRQLRERHRFMKGLFAWIGFRQAPIFYERDARFAGTTKWNYWKLWNLSIEGITSFTIAPLKAASYIGSVIALVAFLYGLYMIIRTILFGNPVAGYPSLLVAVLFLGGVQLIFLGIMGEYLGRTFNEVKQRPLYLIRQWDQSMPEPTNAVHDANEIPVTERVTTSKV
jgi:glycosyltransferase involved in cell wall biosynthesis